MVLKFYELDESGYIAVTADSGGTTTFNFPDDFDFSEQNYYKIIDGQLIEDTEKRAEEQARRQAELSRSTIADLEDICCDLDMRIAELEGQNG